MGGKRSARGALSEINARVCWFGRSSGKSRQDRRIPGDDKVARMRDIGCPILNRRSAFLCLSGRVLEILGRSTGGGDRSEKGIPMNPAPPTISNCHLQFIGASVGLLRAVVRVAVRRPAQGQWSLVPAARR